MILTKEQQAQKYAEKIAGNTCMAPVIAETWLAGYTAAEQSQWRSVEEELPCNDDKVFVIIYGAYVCGWYNRKYELWEIFGMGSYNRKDASYWMPIPSLPDTNTEKK